MRESLTFALQIALSFFVQAVSPQPDLPASQAFRVATHKARWRRAASWRAWVVAGTWAQLSRERLQ